MKNTSTLQRQTFYCLVIILKLLCLLVKAEEGCPPSENIRPCVCYNSPYTVLQCISIQNENVLKDVFSNSKGYKYREVHITFASLKYLPKELFENTEVSELHLTNSTLNTLFDSPPENLKSLYKLHIENTKVNEISYWKLLEHLTHLRHVEIYYNSIENIDLSMGKYISKSVAQLVFYGTGTKSIEPGALVDLPNLNRFSLDHCKLKEISRDIFPTPSNIMHIYFNDNEIKSIPDDMFNDMPRLVTVGLRDNLLVTVPELAFKGNVGRLQYLFLDGNPLKCNCSLKWLVNNKPISLNGSCATPLRLHDKPLKDLIEKDLKCPA